MGQKEEKKEKEKEEKEDKKKKENCWGRAGGLVDGSKVLQDVLADLKNIISNPSPRTK